MENHKSGNRRRKILNRFKTQYHKVILIPLGVAMIVIGAAHGSSDSSRLSFMILEYQC